VRKYEHHFPTTLQQRNKALRMVGTATLDTSSRGLLYSSSDRLSPISTNSKRLSLANLMTIIPILVWRQKPTTGGILEQAEGGKRENSEEIWTGYNHGVSFLLRYSSSNVTNTGLQTERRLENNKPGI